MDDLKKIVWLASYPKSGNTWFRAFLTALLDPEGKLPDINQLHLATIASSRQLFDELAGVASADLTADEIDHLRPKIYRLNAIESEETIYHKIHDAYTLLQDGKSLIPDNITKAVLYFIRNPLDVAVSFSHHLSISIDKTIQIMNNPDYAFCDRTDRLHNQLRQRLCTWSGHVKSWVDKSGLPLIVIRYEDMLDDPPGTFGRATEFIGLEYNKQQVNEALEKCSFDKLREQEKAKGFQEKSAKAASFFRKGISGDWKNVLTPEQVQQIVKAHGEVMERFGYLND
ncbi:MAG: sulfotransferase domain-containing protein [Bacteroidales bacterium]|nr:sulfotransferase domain-containing protein [Bacteroidales bacterium]